MKKPIGYLRLIGVAAFLGFIILKIIQTNTRVGNDEVYSIFYQPEATGFGKAANIFIIVSIISFFIAVVLQVYLIYIRSYTRQSPDTDEVHL